MKNFGNPKKKYFSNFDLKFKFIFQGKFLPGLVNFIYCIQKHFLDVSQMSLVSEIPLFEIILQILDPEDKKIEYSKKNSKLL